MIPLTAQTKVALLAKAKEILHQQNQTIEEELDAIEVAVEGEEKSSAGDKYETQLEMLHQSRDILEKRKANNQLMLRQLNAVPMQAMKKVQEGVLLKLPMGKIWVSVPVGKLNLDGVDYQLVSQNSPLIQALWGLGEGEGVNFRNQQVTIEDLI
ncbi:hypothetical protein [Pararhodonellum marinum]|uniref:hypothetical protein n=1 Tax=Pararhodonellum marinum TaxID=2755358 RepID=UPI00188F9EE7|nr:hypothetical protein [Pararhodonellum marinum]